jgi:hypothetical protein
MMDSLPPTPWSQMMEMFASLIPEERKELEAEEEFQVNEVLPNLFITRYLLQTDPSSPLFFNALTILKSVLSAYIYGSPFYPGPPITHILSLLTPGAPLIVDWSPDFPADSVQQKLIEVDDNLYDDITQYLAGCVDFIRNALASSNSSISRPSSTAAESYNIVATFPTVVVHSEMGKSRSAAVVMAFLMRERGMGFDEALKMLKRARPMIDPNSGFRAQLRLWEACEFDLWERDTMGKVVRGKWEYLCLLEGRSRLVEAHAGWELWHMLIKRFPRLEEARSGWYTWHMLDKGLCRVSCWMR